MKKDKKELPVLNKIKRGKELPVLDKKPFIVISIFILIIIILIIAINVSEKNVSTEEYSLALEVEEAKIQADDSISIIVRRNIGDGELVKIRFIFENETFSEIIDKEAVLDEFEKKSFVFTSNEITILNILRVSIAPIFKDESNEESVGELADRYNVRKGVPARDESDNTDNEDDTESKDDEKSGDGDSNVNDTDDTSVNDTNDTIQCSCDVWTDDVCGSGGCNSSQIYQTRNCNPAGCNIESRCLESSSCSQPSSVCGNGIVESGEECDDGNTQDGDGCSSSCLIESCDCGSWTNNVCGGGSCSSTKMQQTRSCSPSGCSTESRCVSDSSCTSQPSSIGPLIVSQDNPRYFETPSGEVIYVTGSHNWGNLQDLNGRSLNGIWISYEEYLNLMENYNHNFMRMWMWENAHDENTRGDENADGSWTPNPWARPGPGTAQDGKPKFDVTKFNQNYFDRLRQRIIEAGDRGIYVSIMLFQGWAVNRQPPDEEWDPWNTHPFNQINNINGVHADNSGINDGVEFHTLRNSEIVDLQKKYIRKVIDTVNDLDNVLYEICNECGGARDGDVSSTESNNWQQEMVSYIRSYESSKPKQHLVGITPFDADDKTKEQLNDQRLQSNADWISFNHESKWGNNDDEYASNPPATDGTKVSILDNDHIGVITTDDPEFAREWVWKSFMRGHNPIWMDVPNSTCCAVSDSTADSYRSAMGRTLLYGEKMNLETITPQNSLSTTNYVLADPGNEYLIYQPDSGSFSVNMVSGTYNYEWYNPVTGNIDSTGSITVSSGNRFFFPPFSGEAILYLKRV